MKKVYRKKQETVRGFDLMRRTTCCNCPAGCGVKVYLKDGKVVDIFGDEDHPINKGSFCPKGLLSYYHMENPNRIVAPQIRENLSTPFEKVSWQEALGFAADRLKRVVKEKGPESVFIHSGEMAPFEYTAAGSEFSSFFHTANTKMPFLPSPFAQNGIVSKMFGVPASQLLMNSQRDWCNSRCILLYGCDLAASDPVTFGPVLDARDRGAMVLAIDSTNTVTGTKANRFLRAKPGSFSIILKGFINYLIQNKGMDESFIEESTDGFDDIKEFVRKFTPDYVAENCWVNKDVFEEMAVILSRVNPVQIMAGDWFSRRYLSQEDLFLCGVLVGIKGAIGIPGGGLNILNATPFPVDPETENLKHHPGRTPIDLENSLLDPATNVGAIITYGNTFAKMRGGKKVKEALDRVPFVVNLTSFPDETYKNSHVALPMSDWLEYDGLIAHNNTRTIQWHNQVVQPAGECRSALDFWTDLSVLLGFEKELQWKNENDPPDPRKAADYFLLKNPLTRSMSVADLDPEANPPGGVLWPCTDEKDLGFENSRFVKGDIRGRNFLFQRNKNYPLTIKRFPSPSGKISLRVPPELRSRVKTYRKKEKFPLMLIPGVEVDYVENLGNFISDRKTRARSMAVRIHPHLGKILAVKNGETIVVENDFGSFSAPVWLNHDVDVRTIWCPEIMNEECGENSCSSPLSLFELGEPGAEHPTYTWVTVYKQGMQKEEQRIKMETFLSK